MLSLRLFLPGMTEHVRNICIIAHVDHGKTTLSDALVRKGGLSHKDRALDHARPDQADRNITIKSTGASLQLEELSVNLVDTPGHVDFSAEVSSAVRESLYPAVGCVVSLCSSLLQQLRLSDGCLLVVDAASGVKVQTITVLKQALAEGVRPVLVLNKLDRLFVELQLSPEEMYARLAGVVDQVNDLLHTYSVASAPPVVLSPLAGNVIFASGKQSWGFSLPQLARLLAAKAGVDVSAVLPGLWGEAFVDPATRKWSKRHSGGRVRGFCRFVAEPLVAGFMALHTDGDWSAFAGRFLEPLGLDGAKEQKTAALGMSGAVPLSAALIAAIREQLPSPRDAQLYRAALLYTGPRDDAVFHGIQQCDPAAPLCIYVAKLTPGDSGFWAFGRVLSGTVHRNARVHCVGPAFDATLGPHQADTFENVSVQMLAVPRGAEVLTVESVAAGSLVLLGGVEKFLNRTGTIVAASQPLSSVFPVKGMKYTVSAVVAVSVRPKKASEQPAFSKALQKLSKTDNLVQITFDAAAGETVIAGAGELHLEIVLSDLRALAKIELVVGEPVVALRETVVGVCPSSLAKSSNKHNRIFMRCEPLNEHLRVALEQGHVAADAKERNALLSEHPEYGVDTKNPKKLWALGGEAGGNLLSDGTHGVDYLHEVQSVFVTGLNRLVVNGPLCGEPVHGVSWSVQDVKLHADRAHRSDLLEAVRRSLSGSLLQAEPRLLEPILLATIEVPCALVGAVYTFLASRQARVVGEEQHEGAPVATMTAHLPALQSLGFDAALRKVSSGAAFCSLAFSHYQLVDSDPLEEGSLAHRLVADKRKQKGLAPLDVASFVDRL